MKFYPLTTPERAELGHTHVIEVTADDLTQTTVATAQTLNTPHTFAIGDFVERITWLLETPFQDFSDNAFNTDTVSVGDSVGGVATILAATEANLNGSEVLNKTAVPTGTPSTGFTAATVLTVTFNSMAAKALNDIDRGVLYLAMRAFRPAAIGAAVTYGPYITK
jgi:hypothetical protein